MARRKKENNATIRSIQEFRSRYLPAFVERDQSEADEDAAGAALVARILESVRRELASRRGRPGR